MCGILGTFGYYDEAVFSEALDRIAHRGPDGHYVRKIEDVMLGHRRLSIIDLSEKANQPMTVLNRYSIVFNGEIYNYRELKKELLTYGHQFFSESDTEVLLYAYVQWKEKCLDKLNGMWAFAIWDNETKTFFLSRDRIGKKPLFYSFANNCFVFASEMKAIYPFLPEIKVNTGQVRFAEENNFHYENQVDCLIEGIQRFPAGSYGYFKNNKLTIEKFWKPLEQKMNVPLKYEDQVELFRELFLDSCRIRMRSDVPIGTALSGGIDSSAIICAMAENSKKKYSDTNKYWQHAFVASFPGTYLDETAYAKEVVNHLDIKATFVEMDPTNDIQNIFFYTYQFEELYPTTPLPFISLYGQIKKHGISVTLDGHGGDELFAGYPWDVKSAMRDAYPYLNKIRNVLKTYYGLVRDEGEKLNISSREVAGEFKNLTTSRLQNILSSGQGKIATLDYLNSALYKSTYLTMLPTLLRNYDHYSMINGVEIRMPFLDHRILSFAFSIPWDSKIKNGFSKKIVRDALKHIMPEKIVNRKNKMGFGTPFNEWIKGPLRNWVLDEMSSQSFEESNLINPSKVKNEVLRIINKSDSSHADGQNAFRMLMPYIWEKSLQYAYKPAKVYK